MHIIVCTYKHMFLLSSNIFILNSEFTALQYTFFLTIRKMLSLQKSELFFLKMEVTYILIVIHGLYNNKKMHIFCLSKNVVGIS